MKKKFFAGMMAAIALFSLSACGTMSQQKTTHLVYNPVSQVSEAPTGPIPTKLATSPATK